MNLYQGKQTVVECGAGYPAYYKQVNTYGGSQYGWLIDTVSPEKVELTKKNQLRRLGQLIADYKTACTNPAMRIHATLIHVARRVTR